MAGLLKESTSQKIILDNHFLFYALPITLKQNSSVIANI
jgi:hypothetical protein